MKLTDKDTDVLSMILRLLKKNSTVGIFKHPSQRQLARELGRNSGSIFYSLNKLQRFGVVSYKTRPRSFTYYEHINRGIPHEL